jgi:hypothetical protein
VGLKSAYREKSPNKSAEEIKPSEKIEVAPVIRHESDSPPNEAVREAIAKADVADESTLRLRQQLDSLTHSEGLQRRHQTAAAAAQQQQQQVLQYWRQNGLDERYLREHPELVLRLTDLAGHQAAQQGHQPGSAEHTEAAKAIFHRNLAHLEHTAATPPPAAPAPQPTPEFFRPPPPPPEPDRTAMYSAPPSRQTASNGYREDTPRSVRLSAEQREAARLAGIDEVTYARNWLRMKRGQSDGSLQS